MAECNGLNPSLLACVVAFCDMPTIVRLLDASGRVFDEPTKYALNAMIHVNLSFLQLLPQNANANNPVGPVVAVAAVAAANINANVNVNADANLEASQEETVSKFLKMLDGKVLRLLDLSGLRHLKFRDENHLHDVLSRSVHLQHLNLSSCRRLDTDALVAAIQGFHGHCLTHLSMQGCRCVNNSVVDAIAANDSFHNLQALLIGGCSASITSRVIHRVLERLTHLRFLDLSSLNHLTDRVTESPTALLDKIPSSAEVLGLSSCESLTLSGTEQASAELQQAVQQNNALVQIQRIAQRPAYRHKQLKRLDFNNIGSPRRGLVQGALSYFALGGCLREVHLNGCEQVQDWEVKLLAITCSETLTCVEFRACLIGNEAVEALAIRCQHLADCDFSACFRISDAGIVALCRSRGSYWETANQKRQKTTKSRLTSLKLAHIATLTDTAIHAIAALDALIVLDVNGCQNVSAKAVVSTVFKLPRLLDLDARDITIPLSARAIVSSEGHQHATLRFLNRRQISNENSPNVLQLPGANESPDALKCCTARLFSQRLLQEHGVPLQAMFHCNDCDLTPEFNRGVCRCCASSCHASHSTFPGALARFYCDCAFNISHKSECRAFNLDLNQCLDCAE